MGWHWPDACRLDKVTSLLSRGASICCDKNNKKYNSISKINVIKNIAQMVQCTTYRYIFTSKFKNITIGSTNSKRKWVFITGSNHTSLLKKSQIKWMKILNKNDKVSAKITSRSIVLLDMLNTNKVAWPVQRRRHNLKKGWRCQYENWQEEYR